MFASAAILTLALGIGANTAIFSMVDATVLRPLPYAQSDRLVQFSLREPQRGIVTSGVGPRDFLDWREQQQVFDEIAAYLFRSAVLVGGGEPLEIELGMVTPGFFETLRIAPATGRLLVDAGQSTDRRPDAVLTHRFWRSRFGADADVVGRSMQINETSYEIVGVLPEGFEYPVEGGPEVFVPLAFSAEERQHGQPQNMVYACIGRLRHGLDSALAANEMTQLLGQMAPQRHPMVSGFSVVELTPLLERQAGAARPLMLMLLAAVGLVLLIACANVSNLILAHGTVRTRELTLRAALGADGGRLVRQLLAETMVLACLGAGLGLLLAWWGVGVLREAVPAQIPRGDGIGIDLRVLGFTIIATGVCGLVCGLLPAWHARRVDLVDGLKGTSGTASAPARPRLRQAIALAEVALAILLLVGSGLFAVSYARLMRIDPGFEPEGVLSVRLSLPRVPGGAPRGPDDLTRLVEAVQRVPGVGAAGLASSGGPFTRPRLSLRTRVAIVGRPAPEPTDELIGLQTVGRGFFGALEAPLHNGRVFGADDDRGGVRVAVLNESGARRFWGGRDPIGDRITIDEQVYEIVGVVGDIRYVDLEAAPGPQLYLAFEQTSGRAATLLVRTAGDPLALLPAVKAAIWSVDPRQPVAAVTTGSRLFERATATRRFNMFLMAAFGVVALALATIGVFGVMAFIVGHRTHEIGVRLALGARRRDVAATVFGEGAAVLAGGITLGLTASWWLSQTAQSFLYEVEARDPVVFAGGALVLLVIGVVACWVPARRAAAVDPVVALRDQ
jgi:putative ABC transport system permease protein